MAGVLGLGFLVLFSGLVLVHCFCVLSVALMAGSRCCWIDWVLGVCPVNGARGSVPRKQVRNAGAKVRGTELVRTVEEGDGQTWSADLEAPKWAPA